MPEKETPKTVPTSKKTVATVATSWIITILSIVFALLKGGAATVVVPCNNGGKCAIIYDQSTGILDMVDDCKFKEVGDKCKVAASATAIYEQAAPAGTETVKPVEAAPEADKPVDGAPTDTEKPAENKAPDAEAKEEPAKLKPTPETTGTDTIQPEVKPVIKEEVKTEEKKEESK